MAPTTKRVAKTAAAKKAAPKKTATKKKPAAKKSSTKTTKAAAKKKSTAAAKKKTTTKRKPAAKKTTKKKPAAKKSPKKELAAKKKPAAQKTTKTKKKKKKTDHGEFIAFQDRWVNDDYSGETSGNGHNTFYVSASDSAVQLLKEYEISTVILPETFDEDTQYFGEEDKFGGNVPGLLWGCRDWSGQQREAYTKMASVVQKASRADKPLGFPFTVTSKFKQTIFYDHAMQNGFSDYGRPQYHCDLYKLIKKNQKRKLRKVIHDVDAAFPPEEEKDIYSFSPWVGEVDPEDVEEE